MKTVNMHEAKTHLSKLVEQALQGQPFVIAKAGKPLVQVTMIETVSPQRTGFLKGQVEIPADFDDIAADEIKTLFEGETETDPGAQG
jgi:prevent-host-death family protein